MQTENNAIHVVLRRSENHWLKISEDRRVIFGNNCTLLTLCIFGLPNL